jgi:hypothetical protein
VFFFEGGRVASLRLLQKENVAANIEQKNKEIEKLRKISLFFKKSFAMIKKIYTLERFLKRLE